MQLYDLKMRSEPMRMLVSPVMTFVALVSCCDLPRDAAGTTQRIEESGHMIVAVLPGTPDAGPALDMLNKYAHAHGAILQQQYWHGEHAVHLLEQGRVDALIGHYAKNSPWKSDVSLSAPVMQKEPHDSDKPVLRIARQNGENALILAIDRAITNHNKP